MTTVEIGRAQPPPATAVEPASYERGVRPEALQSVHFVKRQPLLGDQFEQTLSVRLQLDTMVRQGNAVLEQEKTAIGRHQRRAVTATDIQAGRIVAVTVRYIEAKRQVASGQTAADLQARPATPQPVEGKVYRCRREGEELRITDDEGNIPPLDEFEIVAQNMDSLGRPNPLAVFLAGRTVEVGETIQLPNEVAEKLLGLGDTLGKVARFRLTLERVKAIGGTPCAVFRADIETASNDSSQMRLQLNGLLAIQVATCRAVQANLAGPIGMSETRGSLTATYQFTGTGKMKVNIVSVFDDVRR